MSNQNSKENTGNDWLKMLAKLSDEDVEMIMEDYPNSQLEEKNKRRTMATLLSLYECTQAKETGILFMDIISVRKVSGLGMNNLKTTLNWLKKHDYIDWKPGVKRQSGVKDQGQASQFLIHFETLENPNEHRGVSNTNKSNLNNRNLINGISVDSIEKNTTGINGISTNGISENSIVENPTESNGNLLENTSEDFKASDSRRMPLENTPRVVNEKLLGIQSDKEFFENCCKLITEDFHGFSEKVVERFNYLNDQGKYWSIAEKYLREKQVKQGRKSVSNAHSSDDDLPF